jgi:hypothetical protein
LKSFRSIIISFLNSWLKWDNGKIYFKGGRRFTQGHCIHVHVLDVHLKHQNYKKGKGEGKTEETHKMEKLH